MKKFNHPDKPTWAFEGAHPSHGYGGHAARSWSKYSTLTIYEVTALSFGINPYTCESFWEDRLNYGTLQIGMWNDRMTEIIRAVYSGEIRTAQPCTEITKETLVHTCDVEKYFKSQNQNKEEIALDNPQDKANKEKNDTVSETERRTLLKIILGMAMDSYGYSPGATKNIATGNNKNSICAALHLVGLNVTDDTIRNYLKEACEIFPDITPKA